MGAGLKRAKKAAKAPRGPFALMTHSAEYIVDGGSVRECRIELMGPEIDGLNHRSVTLFIPRGELQFCPIGAKVRVTVERFR